MKRTTLLLAAAAPVALAGGASARKGNQQYLIPQLPEKPPEVGRELGPDVDGDHFSEGSAELPGLRVRAPTPLAAGNHRSPEHHRQRPLYEGCVALPGRVCDRWGTTTSKTGILMLRVRELRIEQRAGIEPARIYETELNRCNPKLSTFQRSPTRSGARSRTVHQDGGDHHEREG